MRLTLGGMSVSNLMLSPLTKGMFKRAISQSGVATSGSFLWTPERARKYLHKQLPKLGRISVNKSLL